MREGRVRRVRRVRGVCWSEEKRGGNKEGGGEGYKDAAADSQLTDLVGYFL